MARPLIARHEEVAAIRDAVGGAVAERQVRVVVVDAAPGMGASALADVAEAEARAVGASVVRAPADAAPFPAIDGDGPVVAIVEQLHRAGEAGVDALRRAVAGLAHPALALVVTTRDTVGTPAHDLVGDLVARGARRLTLGPLTDEQAVAIVEHELGATCGPTLRRLVARAGGVPLAVVELVDGLRREGRLDEREGTVDADDDELPASLREGVLRSLGDIPSGTLDVLRVAAALGPVFDLADLALVLGRPVTDVVHDLDPVERAGLVVHDGSRRSFVHALVHDALYGSVAPALRSAVHGEIAGVLATAGQPPHALAPHLAAAGGMARPELAADTAWALRGEAPGLALEVCEAALAAGGADDATRDRLVAASVWPLVVRGRLADATATASDLLGRTRDRAIDVEMRWCLVAALQRQGEAERARDELALLVERPDLDPDERHRLRIRLPGAHVFCGDLAAAEAAADDLVGDGELGERPDVVAAATTARVFGRLARGDVAGALAVAEEGEVARRRPGVPAEGVAIAYPMALVEADRFDDARRVLRDRAGDRRAPGDAALTSVYDTWLLVIDVLAGEWDAAAAVLDDAAARAAAGDRIVSAAWTLCYPAAMCVRRDDVGRAASLVALAERALDERGPQNGADVVLWSRALVLDARGATAEAAALVGTEWDLTATTRYFQSWRSIAPDVVRLSLAVGDRRRAAAVVEDAEEGARRAPGVASAVGAALRCRGLLDGDPDVLVAAVDALDAGPRRPDTAAAAHDAGAALAAAGRRPEALAALDRARSLASSMGARRDLRTIESRLSLLGAGSRRTSRDGILTGWDSLTAREVEVVALVADGLRNPQIAERLGVSRHTVESHLKRIYLKLGVTSRAQLAAEALRRPNT